MKRKLIIVCVVVVLVVTLTACDRLGLGSGGETAAGQAGDEGRLPLVTRLLIGTFKLEGTDQAVTAEQAGELLTLWRAYRSLTQSDSTAPQELEALVRQIQETMTPEQMQAIGKMELTQEDVLQVMQDASVEVPAIRQRDRDMEGERAGFPEGGMPMPGGGFPGAGGSRPDFNAPEVQTRIAEHANAGGAGLMGNSALMDALIKLLASKAA